MTKKSNVLTLSQALSLQREGNPFGISCGLGTDSVAMLVKMHQEGVQPDFIVFADVGSEKPHTYGYYHVLTKWLQDNGMKPLVVVRRKPTTNVRGTYNTIFEQCIVNKTLPSLAFGFKKCSNKWKVEPMQFYERHSGVAEILKHDASKRIIKAIGYDAGPKDSRRGTEGKVDKRYLYTYPLRDWGLTRTLCKELIADAGLPDPEKSACFFCPASSIADLRELCKRWPHMGRGIILMEANAWENLRKVRGLWSTDRKGFRSIKKPGSMTEFIIGEELLPEFEGQGFVDPWWLREGPVRHNPNTDFDPRHAERVMRLWLDANPKEKIHVHNLWKEEEKGAQSFASLAQVR